MPGQNTKGKSKYESPVLVPLGELARGSGACGGGSSVIAPSCSPGSFVGNPVCSPGHMARHALFFRPDAFRKRRPVRAAPAKSREPDARAFARQAFASLNFVYQTSSAMAAVGVTPAASTN